jgi:hypothetical protein
MYFLLRRLGLLRLRLLAVTLGLLSLSPQDSVAQRAGSQDVRFTLGQPMDNPVATVSIQEISQGSKKQGFLRIRLLPAIWARGVDVRLRRPEFGALIELQETLQSMLKLEDQEWKELRVFTVGDAVPRLTVKEAVPKGQVWILKNARIRVGQEWRNYAHCTLQLKGSGAGTISAEGSQPISLDLSESP